MSRCWFEMLVCVSQFWRAVSLILFGGAIFGSLLMNLPGRPVVLSDILWLLACAVIVMIVHFALFALAHRHNREA